MPTKLIQLADGMLIEAETSTGDARPISGGAADKVNASLEDIEGVLVRVCQPVANVWRKMENSLGIEQAEIELGLSFEAEGNLFITKAKAGANLTVTLTLKHKAAATA